MSFFCTNNFLADQPCFTSATFASANLQDLCTSGDCVKDCLQPSSLYENVSQVTYDQAIPLYAICTATTNITRTVATTSDPPDVLTEHFPISDVSIFEQISASATTCLVETCQQGRHPEDCDRLCSPTHLLVNNTTPSLQGQSDCLMALCSSRVALPFANADVSGIGVRRPPTSLSLIDIAHRSPSLTSYKRF